MYGVWEIHSIREIVRRCSAKLWRVLSPVALDSHVFPFQRWLDLWPEENSLVPRVVVALVLKSLATQAFSSCFFFPSLSARGNIFRVSSRILGIGSSIIYRVKVHGCQPGLQYGCGPSEN